MNASASASMARSIRAACSGAAILLGAAASGFPAQDTHAEWVVEPDLRIGAVDGPQALTTVRGLVIDRRGRVYVLQHEDSAVRVFGTDGTPVWTLGRRGRGPGEFQLPMQIGLRGDTLWVYDGPMRRISHWHDGRLIDTRPFEPPDFGADYAGTTVVSVLPDAVLIVLAMPRGSPEGRLLRNSAIVAVVGPDVREAKEIAHLRLRDPPVLVHGTGWRSFLSYQPLDDGTLVRVSPDGRRSVLVERTTPDGADPARFAVVILGARGDTLVQRWIPYRPRRVTSEAVDRMLEVPLEHLEPRFPSRSAARRALRAALHLPDYHPPVSDAVVGSDHSIWLRREDTRTAVVEWLVLDPDAVPVARVEFPAGTRLHHVDPEFAWGVEQDERDIPYLVRYRIGRER